MPTDLIARLLAIACNAAMPTYTAWRYVEYALDPGRFDEAYSEWLATLIVAQLPLALVTDAFAAVVSVAGPWWQRALIYLVIIAVMAAGSTLAGMAWNSEIGAVVGWAIVMQLTILVFAGRQPELARARIEAVWYDSANLIFLTPFAGLIAVGIVLAAKDSFAWLADSALTDLAWIGAAYFAMRAWSAVYVYTGWFEARRKGFFQRAWIDKLTTKSPRGDGQ